MKKKILILYEKSLNIGMGHYYRSLRLKNLLKKNYSVKLSQFKKKDILKKVIQDFDLIILDFKSYPKIKSKKKIIIFEDIYKKNKGIISINPLDIFLKNSGPEYFLFPKNLENNKYNFDKKKKINILFLQGAKDSNNQLYKIVKYIFENKEQIKFNFRILSKLIFKDKFSKFDYKTLNFNKDVSKIYKGKQIAVSSVGNTAFELGKAGIPTIHYTIEEREIKRAKIFKRINLGNYIKKDDKKSLINELNKIYFNDNYRKNLIKNRKNFFNKKNKLLDLISNEI